MTAPAAFADRVAHLRADYDFCFGCGRENNIGLHLDDFRPLGDTGIAATFAAREDFRGFSGVIHGGIIATAIDEVLAWTAILVAGVLAVTAKLEIRYRDVAEPGASLIAEGTLDDRRGRRLVLSGVVRDGDRVIADAKGLFLVTADVPDVGA